MFETYFYQLSLHSYTELPAAAAAVTVKAVTGLILSVKVGGRCCLWGAFESRSHYQCEHRGLPGGFSWLHWKDLMMVHRPEHTHTHTHTH